MKTGSCIVTDKEKELFSGVDMFEILASKGIPLKINEYGYYRACEDIQIFSIDNREHEFTAFGWAI